MSPRSERMIRVAYYWLDATSASFLIGGILDNRLMLIMGRRPIILSNSIYKDFAVLVQKFGVMQEVTATDDENHLTTNFNISIGDSEFTQLKFQKAVKPARIYSAETLFYYPDLDAMQTILRTKVWPDDYGMYYIDNLLEDGTGTGPKFPNVVLWRDISRQDLDGYKNLLNQATKVLTPGDIYFPNGSDVVEPTEANRQKSMRRFKKNLRHTTNCTERPF